MQRNLDLIKRIALAAAELTNGGNDPLFELEDVSQQEFYVHAKLMCDASLVEAKFMSDPDGIPIAAIIRLTSSGHEFLDAGQNDTVWNKIKEALVRHGGPLGAQILLDCIRFEIKKHLPHKG